MRNASKKGHLKIERDTTTAGETLFVFFLLFVGRKSLLFLGMDKPRDVGLHRAATSGDLSRLKELMLEDDLDRPGFQVLCFFCGEDFFHLQRY